MKKSNAFFLMSLILLGAATFVSCEKEEVDNEKPVIRLIAPEEDEAIRPGSDIHFEVEFSDNVGLASYKVNIHGAFDGHTHSAAVQGTALGTNDSVDGTRAESDDTESEAFEKTWFESDFIALGDEPIAGKRGATVHHHHMTIPETITVNGIVKPVKEGHYHFLVYCTDESGLESFIAREILISSDAEEHFHH